MQCIMFTKYLKDLAPGELAASLKSIGMDGADLCVRPGYQAEPETAEETLPEVVRVLAEEGLSVPLVTGPADLTDPAMEDAERLFAACGSAGVGLIKIGYWLFDREQDYQPQVDACRKRLEGFARLAAEHSVKAVVHTHSGPYMGLNASASLRLVEGFDPERVGVFLDAGHLSICGEPMEMAISIVRDYVCCFAFKDFVRLPGERDGREVYYPRPRALGWGAVDWEGVLKAIVEAGLQDVTASLHSEYDGMPQESVLNIAAADVRLVRDLLEKAASG